MESETEETIEGYLSVDFYKNQTSKEKLTFSLIMDISEIRPGELELEDEIRMSYLWKKYVNK